jgi:hypothetical protein
MAKLRILAGTVFLAICVAGCAEFRHDSADFGGYYLTSLVEHVGHRLLTVERVYLTDNFVIAEARLTKPTGKQPELVGKRFLVASRDYVDAQVKQMSALKKGSQLHVLAGPFVTGDVKQLIPESQGWVLWPETLGALDNDPTLEDLLQVLQCKGAVKYAANKVPYRIDDDENMAIFYYPHYVDTRSTWQEHEYLVYRPIPTTLFKCLVVPPAMIVDTVSLPVVGVIYLTALLSQPWGHGP